MCFSDYIMSFWFQKLRSCDDQSLFWFQSHLMMVLESVAHLKVRDWEDYQESTYFFPIIALTSTFAPRCFERDLGLHELVFEEYVPPDQTKVSLFSLTVIPIR